MKLNSFLCPQDVAHCQTKIYCTEEKRCRVGTQRHYRHSVCQDTTIKESSVVFRMVTVTAIFIPNTPIWT